MKKYFLLVSLTILMVSCTHNSAKDEAKAPELANIYIQYQTGCEVRENSAISIYSENGIMMAEKVEPIYYYGSERDSTWIIVMDSSKIRLIKNFINKAKELNGNCPIKSKSVDDYNVCIQNDTSYHINGHCDWEGLDFLSVENALFEERFLQLKEEQMKMDSIDQKQIETAYKLDTIITE